MTRAESTAVQNWPGRTRRDFRLLWGGGAVVEFASAAVVFAEPLIVLRVSNDLVLTGVVMATIAIVSTGVGAIAGTFADRHSRRRTMLICNALQIPLALGIGFMLLMGNLDMTVFAVASIGMAILGGFVTAPELAAITQLVPKEHLTEASGLYQGRMHAANLLGPPLGGLLLGFFPPLLYAFAALSCLLATVTVALIRSPIGDGNGSEATFLRDFAEGWKTLFTHRQIRNLVMMQFWANTAVTGALFVTVLSLEQAGHPAAVIGMAQTAIGVAGLTGASLVGIITKRIPFAALLTTAMTAVVVGALASAALVGSLWMVVPLALCLLLAPSASALVFARITALTTEHTRGRVLSFQSIASSIGGSFVKAPAAAIGAVSLPLALAACAVVAVPGVFHAFRSRRLERDG